MSIVLLLQFMGDRIGVCVCLCVCVCVNLIYIRVLGCGCRDRSSMYKCQYRTISFLRFFNFLICLFFFTKIEHLQVFTLFILLIYSFHTNNINFINIL